MEIKLTDLRIKESKFSLGEMKLGVQKFQGNFEQIEVKSITTEQVVLPSAGKNGINRVTIKPIILQNKIVSPTQEKQVVEADSGFDGLAKIEVGAIPSNLIDTSDATATESDIASGKTAYINGGKVVGNLQLGGKLPKVVDGTATELTAEDLDGATKIVDFAFYQNSSIKSVVVPNSVVSIGYQSFQSAKITDLTIQDGTTTLGEGSFQYCKRLKNVVIGNGVKTIMPLCFDGCSVLENVVFGENVTTIQNWAFRSCSKLNNVVLPSSVNNIRPQAFQSCYALTTITILATTPPTLANTNAFTSDLTTIYIPKGTLSAYQSANNWSSFASKFVELSE